MGGSVNDAVRSSLQPAYCQPLLHHISLNYRIAQKLGSNPKEYSVDFALGARHQSTAYPHLLTLGIGQPEGQKRQFCGRTALDLRPWRSPVRVWSLSLIQAPEKTPSQSNEHKLPTNLATCLCER